MHASAFSPGSLTCFFIPALRASIEETTSAGCGICINRGVIAKVSPGQGVVSLNGKAIEIPAVNEVITSLAPEKITVTLETPLPLGCGFGVSAAACLATAFAIDRRFDLGKPRLDLGHIALAAEIRNRTGIGDVVTQILGGVVLRRWRKGPFDGERIAVTDDSFFVRAFGDLATSKILGSEAIVANVAREGRGALAWLEGNVTGLSLSALIERSCQFAQDAGLVTDPRVAESIQAVRNRGGQASMIMLGQSVMATLPLDADWTAVKVDQEGTRCL